MLKIIVVVISLLSVMVSTIAASIVPSQYIIYAVDTCKIGDRAGTTGNGLIGSAKLVAIGSDAVVNGDILSAGSVNLFDRALVNGSVTAKTAINKSYGVTITGNTSPNTNVVSYTIPTKTFSADTTNITVPLDSSRVIVPGNYGDIIIMERATVTFSNGIYNVKSLIIGNDVKLKLDFPVNGKIEVNSNGSFTIGDRVKTTFLQSDNCYAVSYYSAGTDIVRVGYDGIIYGNITAPNALTIIHDRTQFEGSVYAKKIELQPSVFCEADYAAPDLQITQPVNNSYCGSNTPEIVVKFSDNLSGVDLSSLRIYINGNDRTSYFTIKGDSAVWLVTEGMKLSDGQNTVSADIADRSSNITHSQVHFTIDTQIPVVSISSPAEGFITNQSVVKVTWSADGTAQTIGLTQKLTEGANVITRTFTDAAGNTGTATVNVTLDTQVPVVLISSPVNNSITNQSAANVVWTVDGVVQTTQSSQALTEGSNTITRSVTDEAGNTGTASVNVTLDTQVPVVVISSPAEGFITNQSVINVTWSVDGTAQAIGLTQELTEGANVIMRTFTDAAGNTGTATVNVTLDTQTPVVAISSPADNTITNQSTVAVAWTVDGVAQTNQTTAILTEGANTITRSFTDAAGNTGTASVNVILDTQVPVVAISSPADNSITNQSSATVAWSVDGVAQTTQTTAMLTEGANTITRNFTDAAGNTATASVNVTRDTQAPVVVISSPVNNSITNQSAATVAWSVDGVAQTTQTTATLTEGTNTITRSFTDAAGNTGTASIDVTLDTQVPVVAISAPTNNSITNNSAVTVAWSVDGVTQTTQTTTTLTEGVNTITRDFTDAAGNTGTASVNVTLDTQAPVVAITSPANNTVTTLNTVNVVWTVDCIAQTTQTTATLTNGVNTITRSFTDDAGNIGVATVQITLQTNTQPLPPDPVTVAPKLDSTQFTNMKDATSFLYNGNTSIQTGVVPETIDLNRAAVIRGKVLDRNNNPLSGVKITISGHPEFGQTLSRLDGMFDIAVNGGGYLKIVYEKENFFEVHRQIDAPWQNYTSAPDVVMVQADPVVTPISLTATTEMQVMRGSTVTDNDGTRTATILFPPGIEVTNGNYNTINVRATEYTVGENGVKAMPAELPPSAGYTYCVELSADGLDDVMFNKPVYFYLENFLNFPVGGIVPAGYYSRNGYSQGSSCSQSQEPAWIPSENGRIIRVLSIENNAGVLDVNGSGAPATQDTLDSLGITEEERIKIAGLYQPGQTLWRVPVTHFTPWDCNWPYGPPKDAKDPKVKAPIVDKKEENTCTASGSIIEIQTQILGEKINIVGTNEKLVYQSTTNGRNASNYVNVQLSGDTISASLKRIVLEIEIAGTKYVDSFAPLPNLSKQYYWDGLDAYKRPVIGKQHAIIKIGYAYDAEYQEPGDFAESFGKMPRSSFTIDRSRMELIIWQSFDELIGSNHSINSDIGGWSFESKHFYDPITKILYKGNGEYKEYNIVNNRIVEIAGDGSGCPTIRDFCGDSIPATSASITSPNDVAIGADGSIYICSEEDNCIRKVAPNGLITRYAGVNIPGNVQNCAYRDSTTIGGAIAIAIAPDQSVYFTDDRKIYKINPSGIISLFAGNGQWGYSGNGGYATDASLRLYWQGSSIATGSDGTVYIAETESNVVRQITKDGKINVVAGTGDYGYNGDGIPASNANLSFPLCVAVNKKGEVFIGEEYRIRKVSITGIITTVVGKNYTGDPLSEGKLAINAGVEAPFDIDFDKAGNMYFSDMSFTNGARIRMVDQNGIITTIAGDSKHYGVTDFTKAPLQTSLNYPSGIAVAPDGSIFYAERLLNKVRKIQRDLPFVNNEEISIRDPDGVLIYVFSRDGVHLRTINSITNNIVSQFKYNSNGNLDSIVDAAGNTTTIERYSNGTPVAIVGPYGHRTLLTVNNDGYLSSITNPAGEKVQMTYQDGGLLSSFIDAKGNSSAFEYDSLGRLTKDTDANGGFTSLQRVELEDGYEVRDSTAEGVVKVFRARELPDGTKVKEVQGCCGQSTISYSKPNGETEINSSDNTVVKTTEGPDPIYGMMTPMVKNYKVSLPSGIQMEMRSGKTVSYTSNNEIDSIIQNDTINDKVFRSIYAGTTRTFTTLTPDGRATESTIDSLGRVIHSAVSDLAPVTYVYDERSRISSITEGSGSSSRVWQYEYDNHGSLATVINPLGEHTTYSYDDAERIISKHFADMRQIRFGYDVNGNVQTITSPDNDSHTYYYNSVNLPTEYNPPVINTGSTPTTYGFNLDKDLTSIHRPDGLQLQFKYDSFGRLDSMVTPDGNYVYVYDPVNNKMVSSTTPDSNQLFYSYDGNILNSEISTGLLNDTLSIFYNNNFQRTSRTIAGFNDSYEYDNDGLMLRAGDLNITRNAQNGLITGSIIGNISDALEYNSFGENSQYTVSDGIQNLTDIHYDRDKLGRIITKTETIDGQTHTFVYTYNSSGYLERVSKDGATVALYSFDLNGNRLSYSGITGNRTATYDAQDRMLTNGNVSYTYNVNGDLESKTEPAGITTYTYDVLGNLKTVALPNGKNIEYIVDDKNRRIGKKVNGILVKKWVYEGQLKPSIEYDGQNNIIARYIYGTQINVPEYMIKNGDTFRLITDHLGSVCTVVNVATGEIVQRVDCDEYGIVLSDSNPGYTPFGFAGGLYDPETGLVRFGARDYDAYAGRWTSKDPIGFGGGDANLYRYVNSDPVNFVDPEGEAYALIIPIVIEGAEALAGSIIGIKIGDIICEMSKGGKQNIRQTKWIGVPDEVINKITNTPGDPDRKDAQKEQKARGLRNKQKR